MAQLARTSCRLEACLLRITHKAPITSVAGYGLTLVGSFAYRGLRGSLETQSANIAARRITGVSRAAKLEALLPIADVLPKRNQYIQLCSSVLGRALRALRARNSSIKSSVDSTLAACFGIRSWKTDMQTIVAEEALLARNGGRNFVECDVLEEWSVRALGEAPTFLDALRIPGTFCAAADDILEHREYRQRVFQFNGIKGWIELSAAALLAAG